jgi:hypothetical protein
LFEFLALSSILGGISVLESIPSMHPSSIHASKGGIMISRKANAILLKKQDFLYPFLHLAKELPSTQGGATRKKQTHNKKDHE